MKIDELHVGSVVSGPLLPEPVQVIAVFALGEAIKLVGKGCKTGLGRAEAMKRFVVEEGAGNDPRFWKLAQSLSALYPPGTDEKRWVDGVLARKNGLGF